MTDTELNPVELYRNVLKKEHSNRVVALWKSLLTRSGVDVDANRSLCKRIADLTNRLNRQKSRAKFYNGLGTLFALAAIAVPAVYYYLFRQLPPPFLPEGVAPAPDAWSPVFVWGAVIFCIAMAIRLFLLQSRQAKQASATAQKLQQCIDEAYRQLAPLRDELTWEIPLRLFTESFPRAAFDPFVSDKRAAALYDPAETGDVSSSFLLALSGDLDGSPFGIALRRRFHWGEKTYTGQRLVQWTERRYNPSTKRNESCMQSELLTATVTKPYPVFEDTPYFTFSNPVAPKLSFTRMPSEHTGEKKGMFARMQRASARRKLVKFSRNLSDDSQYTMLSNTDFEIEFQTKDRNDEVGYRLMFTPLAQVLMRSLINDTATGYGDDFAYIKRGMHNDIYPRHFNIDPYSPDQMKSEHFSVDEMAHHFQSFNERFFKSIFFSMAPVLAIPAFRDSPYYGSVEVDAARFNRESQRDWGAYFRDPLAECEREFIANHHLECLTGKSFDLGAILKTEVVQEDLFSALLAVKAFGFDGYAKCDYVPVYCRNGRWYDVPVNWVQYQERTRTGQIAVAKVPNPDHPENTEAAMSSLLKQKKRKLNAQWFRTHLISYSLR